MEDVGLELTEDLAVVLVIEVFTEVLLELRTVVVVFELLEEMGIVLLALEIGGRFVLPLLVFWTEVVLLLLVVTMGIVALTLLEDFAVVPEAEVVPLLLALENEGRPVLRLLEDCVEDALCVVDFELEDEGMLILVLVLASTLAGGGVKVTVTNDISDLVDTEPCVTVMVTGPSTALDCEEADEDANRELDFDDDDEDSFELDLDDDEDDFFELEVEILFEDVLMCGAIVGSVTVTVA